VANDVEVLGMRLLRSFDEEAIGEPRTAVLARDAARGAGFDYGSPDFDAAFAISPAARSPSIPLHRRE